jgi:hypothetical protein
VSSFHADVSPESEAKSQNDPTSRQQVEAASILLAKVDGDRNTLVMPQRQAPKAATGQQESDSQTHLRGVKQPIGNKTGRPDKKRKR